MQLQKPITRRNLLWSSLGVGLALTLAPSAKAAPLPASSHWGGNLTSTMGASTSKVTLDVPANPATGTLAVFGITTNAQLTGTPSNTLITATTGNGTMKLQGTITTLANSNLSFTGTYQTFTPGNVLSDKGNVTLIQTSLLTVISDNPIDGNRASIAILPPDFLGSFLSQGGLRGQAAFHRNVSPRLGDGPIYSEVRGQLRLNDMVFSYTMTFVPVRSTEGSYAFDLIGTNNNGASGVPFITLSGAYFPATGRVQQGSIGGSFQLLNPRTVLDSGRLSMLQVP